LTTPTLSRSSNDAGRGCMPWITLTIVAVFPFLHSSCLHVL
jgi:hypothetical protein